MTVWARKLANGEYNAGYKVHGKQLFVKDEITGKNIRYRLPSEAKRAATEALVEASRQTPPTPASTPAEITWGEWWDRIGGNRHPTSDADLKEKSIVEVHLRPRWGDAPLNGITKREIKRWIKDELSQANLSASYVRRIFVVFKGSLQEAEDAEVLTETPCVGKMGLPVIRKRHVKSYLTLADLDRYREAGMRADYLDWLTFQYETGMRPSEVSGLHVNWIHASLAYLSVVDVLVTNRRAIRSWPKNGQHRTIILTDEAAAIVERLLAGKDDLHQGCGVPHLDKEPCTSALVFRNLLGGPIVDKHVLTTLRRLADREGFEHKTPYAARRAFPTWAIDGGVPTMKVQKQMGHASNEETEGYVQRSPQERDRLRAARKRSHQPPLRATRDDEAS